MSESDDTDLLLLIPPDFFVVHSDSEDSTPSFRGSNSDRRFQELVSQVNELKERINFIESKDSIQTESFLEANRFNQPVDYSFPFDSTNFHNVQCDDVALSFYSLASADLKFEYGNKNSVQFFQPCNLSSSGNYPRTIFSHTQGSKSDADNCAVQVSEMEPFNQQLENAEFAVNYSDSVSAVANETHFPSKIPPSSEHLDFLSEIDEFIEKKNKQLGDKLLHIEPVRSDSSVKYSSKVISDEIEVCRNKYQTFMKLPPTNSMLCENKHFSVVPLEELSQVDLKTKFEHISSGSNVCAAPCENEGERKLNLEKCRSNINDCRHEEVNDLMKESHANKYSSLLMELNSSKFNENHRIESSFSSFCKEKRAQETGINKKSEKQVFTAANTSCGLPRQSSQAHHINIESQSSCTNSESEPLKRSVSHRGVPNSVNKNFTYSSESTECENNSIHSESQTCSTLNKNRRTFLRDKRLINPISSNEFYLPGASVHFEEVVSEEKNCGKGIFSRDAQTCAKNDLLSGVVKDKLKNFQELECKRDINCEFTPVSCFTEDTQPCETLNTKKDIGNHFATKEIQSDIPRAVHESSKGLFIPDCQSDGVTLNTLESKNTNDHYCFSDEAKTQFLYRPVDDIGKTAAPAFADDGYYSSLGTGSSAMNFLSLSNLWGRDAKEVGRKDLMTIEQKLEEEYFRRKHCENVIQKLQSTLLEQQQKLAVAISVDKSKDHTIQQLQTAWKRLVNHWQELEEQRHSISVRYCEEKEKHQLTVMDILQKNKQLELELSKALDLAQGYKENNEIIEQKMKELENSYAEEKKYLQISVQEGQNRFTEAEEKLKIVQLEMSGIKEKLEETEKNACSEKQLVLKTQEEMGNMQKLLGSLEDEISIVKEENSSLRLRLKEERARNDVAEQQIKSFKIALDETRKNEKILQAELKDQRNTLEIAKTDLRDYYQHQLELVVQEKLVEFQTQLDAAETSLHQEMEQKEKLALDAAGKQLKHITEKNLLEVKLLEEKHREELHLCKLQIAQATQEINRLQDQLQSYSNRKVEIVEKLQTVMETQWQEALRIISSSSPVIQPFQQQQQQHIALVKNIPDKDIKISARSACSTVPPLLVPHSSSSSTTDELPFNKEDQLTFRANNEQNRNSVIPQENSDVVKRYIEMLLSRSPGHPLSQEISNERNRYLETYVVEGKQAQKWVNVMENEDLCDSEKHDPSCTSENTKCIQAHFNNESCKSRKPPWK